MTVASVAQQARHYSAAYFNEADAHWGRMVANARDQLMQFRTSMVEGANCVRIAGYDRGRFRSVFTRIAQDNDLVSKIGGPEALQAKLTAMLEHYVEHKKNINGVVKASESKLLPKSTIDAIDSVLIQNDAERLGDFLRGRSQPERQKIIGYIKCKISL
jgi:hypothetical protein